MHTEVSRISQKVVRDFQQQVRCWSEVAIIHMCEDLPYLGLVLRKHFVILG